MSKKKISEKTFFSQLSNAVSPQKTEHDLIYRTIDKYKQSLTPDLAKYYPVFNTVSDFQSFIGKQRPLREWHLYVLPQGEILFIGAGSHEDLASDLLLSIKKETKSDIVSDMSDRFRLPDVQAFIDAKCEDVRRCREECSYAKELKILKKSLDTILDSFYGNTSKLIQYTGVVRVWKMKTDTINFTEVSIPAICMYGNKLTGAQEDTIDELIKKGLLIDDDCLTKAKSSAKTLLMEYAKIEDFLTNHSPQKNKVNVR